MCSGSIYTLRCIHTHTHSARADDASSARTHAHNTHSLVHGCASRSSVECLSCLKFIPAIGFKYKFETAACAQLCTHFGARDVAATTAAAAAQVDNANETHTRTLRCAKYYARFLFDSVRARYCYARRQRRRDVLHFVQK